MISNKLSFLQQFCSTDDSREFMQKPFRIDGFLCATNGHIAVRIPDDASVILPDHESPADAIVPNNFHKVFDCLASFYFLPLKADSLPNPNLCLSCLGSGKVKARTKIKCEDCDGDGSFWHGNHSYDCKECDAEGFTLAPNKDGSMSPCESCGGFKYERYQGYQLHDNYADLKYLMLIASLTNASVSITSEKGKMGFNFDGGEGVLMLMRSPE